MAKNPGQVCASNFSPKHSSKAGVSPHPPGPFPCFLCVCAHARACACTWGWTTMGQRTKAALSPLNPLDSSRVVNGFPPSFHHKSKKTKQNQPKKNPPKKKPQTVCGSSSVHFADHCLTSVASACFYSSARSTWGGVWQRLMRLCCLTVFTSSPLPLPLLPALGPEVITVRLHAEE